MGRQREASPRLPLQRPRTRGVSTKSYIQPPTRFLRRRSEKRRPRTALARLRARELYDDERKKVRSDAFRGLVDVGTKKEWGARAPKGPVPSYRSEAQVVAGIREARRRLEAMIEQHMKTGGP